MQAIYTHPQDVIAAPAWGCKGHLLGVGCFTIWICEWFCNPRWWCCNALLPLMSCTDGPEVCWHKQPNPAVGPLPELEPACALWRSSSDKETQRGTATCSSSTMPLWQTRHVASYRYTVNEPDYNTIKCALYLVFATACWRKRSDASVLSKALLMSAMLMTESWATEVRSCPWPQCDSYSR